MGSQFHPCHVKDHDFGSEAKALVTPYGIYDTQANRGSVCLGSSYDTPAFAVDAIAQWWLQEGSKRYPAAQELFILAGGGGSNGSRPRAWKKALQETICNSLGLKVTVSHYLPGASKWNPIEHRLFSQISRNRRHCPTDRRQLPQGNPSLRRRTTYAQPPTA